MGFREDRAIVRKNNIVKVAARLFSEKGYHEATVEEIATELKYTKGSIYYYISSKQDLLYECHNTAMDLLLEKMASIMSLVLPPDDKLKLIIKAHMELLVSEMNLLTVILVTDYELADEYREKIVAKRDRYEEQIMQVLDLGIQQGVFRQVPKKILINMIMGAINWMGHWYSDKGSMTLEEISEFYAEYLLEPLVIKKSK